MPSVDAEAIENIHRFESAMNISDVRFEGASLP